METFNSIKELIATAEKDAEKFYSQGNGAAGTRLRKAMQDLKNKCQEVRQEVLEIRNKDK